jgi:hypothetical protein
VAHRILGSHTEADAAVQEGDFGSTAPTQRRREPRRMAYDGRGAGVLGMVPSRRSRRGQPMGPQLPEPTVGIDVEIDPTHQALMADSVGPALLVVLDLLSQLPGAVRLTPTWGPGYGAGLPRPARSAAARRGELRAPRQPVAARHE